VVLLLTCNSYSDITDFICKCFFSGMDMLIYLYLFCLKKLLMITVVLYKIYCSPFTKLTIGALQLAHDELYNIIKYSHTILKASENNGVFSCFLKARTLAMQRN
jgi:hypothetical protein